MARPPPRRPRSYHMVSDPEITPGAPKKYAFFDQHRGPPPPDPRPKERPQPQTDLQTVAFSESEQSVRRPPLTTIFIGGLHEHVRDEEFLRELCSPFGKILRVTVHPDPRTGALSQYASVQFGTPKQARSMTRQMNGHALFGDPISIFIDANGRLSASMLKEAFEPPPPATPDPAAPRDDADDLASSSSPAGGQPGDRAVPLQRHQPATRPRSPQYAPPPAAHMGQPPSPHYAPPRSPQRYEPPLHPSRLNHHARDAYPNRSPEQGRGVWRPDGAHPHTFGGERPWQHRAGGPPAPPPGFGGPQDPFRPDLQNQHQNQYPYPPPHQPPDDRPLPTAVMQPPSTLLRPPPMPIIPPEFSSTGSNINVPAAGAPDIATAPSTGALPQEAPPKGPMVPPPGPTDALSTEQEGAVFACALSMLLRDLRSSVQRQLHRSVVETKTVGLASAWLKRHEMDAQTHRQDPAPGGPSHAKALDLTALSTVRIKRKAVTRKATMKIDVSRRAQQQQQQRRRAQRRPGDYRRRRPDADSGDELSEASRGSHSHRRRAGGADSVTSADGSSDSMDEEEDEGSTSESEAELDRLAIMRAAQRAKQLRRRSTGSRTESTGGDFDFDETLTPTLAEDTALPAGGASVAGTIDTSIAPAGDGAVPVEGKGQKRPRDSSGDQLSPRKAARAIPEQPVVPVIPPTVVVGADAPAPAPLARLEPNLLQETRQAIQDLDAEDFGFVKAAFASTFRAEEQFAWFPALFSAVYSAHHGEAKAPGAATPAAADAAAGVQAHEQGCARAAGYYRVDAATKRAVAHGRQQIAPRNKKVKLRQASRQKRLQARRLQSAIVTEDLQEADVLKFSQLKNRKKALRFGRSPIHDWGLFAMEPIPAGSMVIEYVGEVIRKAVAEERERKYTVMGIGSSYLFRLDDSYVVDATRAGAVARFMNHSCDPNCTAQVVTVIGDQKIVIYSKVDIDTGEEITYDYKFPVEDDKVPCMCGSANCKGFLN